MTKDERIASFKYSVLQHARKHNNITYQLLKISIKNSIFDKLQIL